MKNQYVGDIGDYGKLGLLRHLLHRLDRIKLGVNWYLTPDDKSSDGDNEQVLKYLKENNNSEDQDLHKILKNIVESKYRSVYELQNSNILPGAVFYDTQLDFDTCSSWSKTKQNMITYRESWHKKALEKLSGCNFIFLDPDNNIITDKIKPKKHTKIGHKFVTYEEVRDYFNKNEASLIIYCHRDRSSKEEYEKRFLRFCNDDDYKLDCKLICLSFKKVQARDYLFVIQPGYYEYVNNCLEEFEKLWKGYFERRDL